MASNISRFRLITVVLIGMGFVSLLFYYASQYFSSQDVVQVHTTTIALQQTRYTSDMALQKTLVVSAKKTVIVEATKQANINTSKLHATQAAFEATRTLQDSARGTQIAVQIKATQDLLHVTQLVQEHATQKAAIATAVKQTIVAQPTSTPLPTALPTMTATPPNPMVNVFLEGCRVDWSLVRAELGEYTTAFVTIENVGKVDVSGLIVELKASDETSITHPDQKKTIQYLPVGHKVTLDLAIDTKFLKTTNVTVIVTAREGVRETNERRDCRDIDEAKFVQLLRIIRLIVPLGFR